MLKKRPDAWTSAGTPAGVLNSRALGSGGIAPLNHRIIERDTPRISEEC
ncbi:MAG: hypothetical protein ORN51_06705 [Akkermansiaceae bacterium]|nr:hypothetical protein [Akkermansiaceae bacterium]